MKSVKIVSLTLVIVLVLSGSCLCSEREPPEISAKCAVVMEANTGTLLYEKQAQTPMLIASTTKIMTAMLAIETLDPDRSVTVLPAWAGIEGSSMYLEEGQVLTVRELLYGLLLASGNDAAVALACLSAGSVEAFAERMNERAQLLGCEHTHFDNPSGLDSPEHYSCAADLARIAKAALADPLFREIVGTVTKTVGELTYTNHNKLLSTCDGVFGVKTGYTKAAGRTLVSACERGGLTLICVTLADPDDWNDHRALYDWAYSIQTQRASLSRDMRWTLPVISGVQNTVTVAPTEALTVFGRETDVITANIELPRFVYASVQSGDRAGEATIRRNGETVGTVELVYTESVEEEETVSPGWLNRLLKILALGKGKVYSLS